MQPAIAASAPPDNAVTLPRWSIGGPAASASGASTGQRGHIRGVTDQATGHASHSHVSHVTQWEG